MLFLGLHNRRVLGKIVGKLSEIKTCDAIIGVFEDDRRQIPQTAPYNLNKCVL